MNKRGPIIGIAGIGCITISLIIAGSVFPSTLGVDGQLYLENFFQEMFSEISPETQVFPGDTVSFSFTTSESDIPLLWGFQIVDFRAGDKFSVMISNIFGDNFGEFEEESPILFDMFVAPKIDTYNFEVQNSGDRTFTMIAMFAEDPDNSQAMNDPNSPLLSMILPLAVSGLFLIIGIITLIVGLILSVIDWKKGKNTSRFI